MNHVTKLALGLVFFILAIQSKAQTLDWEVSKGGGGTYLRATYALPGKTSGWLFLPHGLSVDSLWVNEEVLSQPFTIVPGGKAFAIAWRDSLQLQLFSTADDAVAQIEEVMLTPGLDYTLWPTQFSRLQKEQWYRRTRWDRVSFNNLIFGRPGELSQRVRETVNIVPIHPGLPMPAQYQPKDSLPIAHTAMQLRRDGQIEHYLSVPYLHLRYWSPLFPALYLAERAIVNFPNDTLTRVEAPFAINQVAIHEGQLYLNKQPFRLLALTLEAANPEEFARYRQLGFNALVVEYAAVTLPMAQHAMELGLMLIIHKQVKEPEEVSETKSGIHMWSLASLPNVFWLFEELPNDLPWPVMADAYRNGTHADRPFLTYSSRGKHQNEEFILIDTAVASQWPHFRSVAWEIPTATVGNLDELASQWPRVASHSGIIFPEETKEQVKDPGYAARLSVLLKGDWHARDLSQKVDPYLSYVYDSTFTWEVTYTGASNNRVYQQVLPTETAIFTGDNPDDLPPGQYVKVGKLRLANLFFDSTLVETRRYWWQGVPAVWRKSERGALSTDSGKEFPFELDSLGLHSALPLGIRAWHPATGEQFPLEFKGVKSPAMEYSQRWELVLSNAETGSVLGTLLVELDWQPELTIEFRFQSKANAPVCFGLGNGLVAMSGLQVSSSPLFQTNSGHRNIPGYAQEERFTAEKLTAYEQASLAGLSQIRLGNWLLEGNSLTLEIDQGQALIFHAPDESGQQYLVFKVAPLPQ